MKESPPPKPPRFSVMNKVRAPDKRFECPEGYEIDSRFKDGRWIYKISISEDPRSLDRAFKMPDRSQN